MKQWIAIFVLAAMPLSAADLAGTWSLTAHSTNRDIQLELVLKQADGKWSGSLSSERGSVELEEVTVSGADLSSKFAVGATNYSLKLTASGDALKGSASSSDGVTVAVDGTRAGGAGAAKAGGVTGKWKMKAVTPSREYEVDLEITEEAGTLGGRIRTSDGDIVPIRDAKARGGRLEFKITVDPGAYTLSFEVGETSMKGTYKAPDGATGTVTATRP